ncbi:MAG TPA: hypothetical protein VK308_01470, partial [Pyrinomonadaceae bacterium]|nr:hypothetical protein [Pyrinomonadaceae bacterium]
MIMIQFLNNYEDLSTYKGFQFKFHCDKCGNGYMSRFQTSTLGVASSALSAATSLLGWGYGASNSAYEIQRAVGGKAHDAAFETAVQEGKQHFHQCSCCGKWVCPEVCWNEKANQCEECAPDFEEQLASALAQAKAEAARQQLYEKAPARKFPIAFTKRINCFQESLARTRQRRDGANPPFRHGSDFEGALLDRFPDSPTTAQVKIGGRVRNSAGQAG